LLIAVPVWVVLLTGIAGLTFLVSALQVFVKDVEHVLMPLLMMLMYLTPILYPLTLVPQNLQPWIAANPFNWVVGRFARCVARRPARIATSDALAAAVAVMLFIAGRWVFRRLSPHFEDFV
jgi:ABC-type polysaccharide/polyol phosphate export permease